MKRLIYLTCSVAISFAAFSQETATVEAVATSTAFSVENDAYLVDSKEEKSTSSFSQIRGNLASKFEIFFRKLGFVSFIPEQEPTQDNRLYLRFSAPKNNYLTDNEENTEDGIVFSLFAKIGNLAMDFDLLFERLGFVTFAPYQERVEATIPPSASLAEDLFLTFAHLRATIPQFFGAMLEKYRPPEIQLFSTGDFISLFGKVRENIFTYSNQVIEELALISPDEESLEVGVPSGDLDEPYLPSIFREWGQSLSSYITQLIEKLGVVSIPSFSEDAEGLIHDHAYAIHPLSVFVQFRQNLLDRLTLYVEKFEALSLPSHEETSKALPSSEDFSTPVIFSVTAKLSENLSNYFKFFLQEWRSLSLAFQHETADAVYVEPPIFSILGELNQTLSDYTNRIMKKLGSVFFGDSEKTTKKRVSDYAPNMRYFTSLDKDVAVFATTLFAQLSENFPEHMSLLFNKLGFLSFTPHQEDGKPFQIKDKSLYPAARLALPSIGLLNLPSGPTPPRRPNQYPIPKRIDMTYGQISGPGGSYGFSRLGAFLGPEYQIGHFLPLLDVGVIAFNNGLLGADVGLIGRFLPASLSQVFGLSLYYTFSQGSLGNFNQLSGGFEVLGKNWETHMNMYAPVGPAGYTKTCNFDDYIGPYHAQLNLHNDTLGYVFEGDVGYYIINTKNFQMYAGGGGYHFSGHSSPGAWGAQVFVRPQVGDYFMVSVGGTYDHIYGFNYQAVATLSIPLYDYSALKNKTGPGGIPTRQLYQPVRRWDTIETTTKCCWNFNWDDSL